MKKYILIFILSFLAGFGLNIAGSYINTCRTKTIHVFFEPYATNPALGQMIEFARLPKSTPKIIAWHRFPNRKKVLDLKDYNTVEIDIPPLEAYYKTATQKVFTHIFDIYKNNPETRFVFYLNFSHTKTTLAPFFNTLPKENIQHIHLFEDGYGEFFKSAFDPSLFYPNGKFLDDDFIKKQLAAAFKREIPWQPVFSSSIHTIYPVTYHIMHGDKIKNEARFKPLRRWWKEAHLKTVDFDELKNSMTKAQKNIVYKLAGFDYEKFYSLMHGKKTVMFTLGYFYHKPHLDKAELNLFSSLKKGQLSFLTAHTPYIWLVKPHPSLAVTDKISHIKTLFPDVIEIPAQVPYEVFILAGLKPTKTAGVGSSLYFSLKKDDILVYVKKTHHDSYINFLIPYAHLKTEQIINLNKFTDGVLKKRCQITTPSLNNVQY